MEGFSAKVFGNGLHYLQGIGVDFLLVLRMAFKTCILHISRFTGHAIQQLSSICLDIQLYMPIERAIVVN